MNRRISIFLIIVAIWASTGLSQTDINQKFEHLDIKTVGLKDVIDLFGEPEGYSWNRQPLHIIRFFSLNNHMR